MNPGLTNRHLTTAEILTGEKLNFFKVPKNVRIAEATLEMPDMDSGTPALVADLILSDGTTTQKLITATTIDQAGGFARIDTLGAIGFLTDTWDFKVYLEVTVDAATWVDGTIGVMVGWNATVN